MTGYYPAYGLSKNHFTVFPLSYATLELREFELREFFALTHHTLNWYNFLQQLPNSKINCSFAKCFKSLNIHN